MPDILLKPLPTAPVPAEHVKLGDLLLMHHRASAPEVCPADAYHLLITAQGSSESGLSLHDPAGGTACASHAYAKETLSVVLPKSLLHSRAEHVRVLLCRSFPAANGIGRLLTDFAVRVWLSRRALRPADGPSVGMALYDLISAWLLGASEDHCHRSDRRPPRQVLYERICVFLERRLRQTDLTPRAIAAAHHISVSYLHRIFQEQGTTVSAWIKARRLERARRDLADPALLETPIHVISETWGFSHPAEFSRAFRRAFGSPPSRFRRQAPAQGAAGS
ncbi:helix-turn-helix transcriptional regulator [Nonomuraea sp. NPDC049309]|uniref:AraC family transcriptional regulator n=1 Tax=Nonomuraea sp. NPDC049309 TaxID=3364350 RepID=UPI00371E6619